jgi:hypothetical protein
MMLVLAALFCSPAGYLGGRIFDQYHSYALFFAPMPVPPEAEARVSEGSESLGERTKKLAGRLGFEPR